MMRKTEEINRLECDCYDFERRSYACPLEDETVTEFFMCMKPPTTTFQQKELKIVWSKKKKKHVPVVYESAELKAARSKLTARLAKHVPAEKYASGVRLTTKWLFPRGKHADGEYKITKPDTDNLQKLLKDCMTNLGFWKDDALVASEVVEKFWAEMPGIYIKIEEIK